MKYLLPILIGGALLPFWAQAYEVPTHAYLTSEIFDFYNKNFPDAKISEELRAYLIDGSRREDDAPRWMNHFYDPVYERGLTSKALGTWNKSKDWVNDPIAQNEVKYQAPALIGSILTAVEQKKLSDVSAATNFTWREAVRYYINGENEKAMFALGHVLHLIEDSAVPDHTRNDPHGEGSPYEKYAGQFTPESEDGGLKNRVENKSPISSDSLSYYFNELAKYSNENFYSKNTIGIQSGYSSPQINYVERNGKYFYGIKEQNDGDYPILIYKRYQGSLLLVTEFDVGLKVEGEDRVMSAYWERLSVKAVQHGAGVINLFFKEVEKAKNDPALVQKKREGFLERSVNSARDGLAAVVRAFENVTSTAGDMVSNMVGLVGIKKDGDVLITSNVSVSTDLNETEVSDVTEDDEESENIENAGLTESVEFLTSETVAESGDSNPTNSILTQNELTPKISEKPKQEAKKEAGNKSLASSNSLGGSPNTPLTYLSNAANVSDGTNTSNVSDGTNATTTSDGTNATSTTATSPPSSETTGGQGTTATSTPETATSTNSGTDNDNASAGENATSTDSGDEFSTSTPDSESDIAVDANHIVISEIFYDAEGGDSGKEFIELYNPTSQGVNISNWALRIREPHATSNSSLADLSREDQNFEIPSKGFFLIGFSNYSGTTTADLVRSTPLPNSARVVSLLDDSNNAVDEVQYDGEIQAGSSWERRAWSSGCVSAQNEGNFFGNGCDTDADSDFEARESPKPQSLASFPEPRSRPSEPELDLSYDSNALTFLLSWTHSGDYAGTTTSIMYEIRLANGDSSFLVAQTESTELAYGIQEINRAYDFTLFAVDRDGLFSDEASVGEFVPNFLNNVYFYRNSAGNYEVEIRYSLRPFIPSVFGRPDSWQGIVIYLNREPNRANQILTTAGNHAPNDLNGIPEVTTNQKYSGIFGFDSDHVRGYGEGLYQYSFMLPEEDGLLPTAFAATTTVFSENDYVTVAFYDFSYSGGGTQNLSFAAWDAKKHYFAPEPARLAPSAPKIIGDNFNEFNLTLGVSWAGSTDADTPDGYVLYELNVSTSSEFNPNAWIDVGGLKSFTTSVRVGNSYHIGVRARDQENNLSEISVLDWNFPEDFSPLVLSSRVGGAFQDFNLPAGGTVQTIQVFTANFRTGSRNPDSNLCILKLYDAASGAMSLISEADRNPADGVSHAYAARGYACGSSPTFTFSSHPELVGSRNYRWNFGFEVDNPNADPNAQFYGRDTNTAGGMFSDPSFVNARFKITASDGAVLFDN